MRPGDDPQDAANELRVTDRRRFNAEGDIRDDEDAASPQAAEPPAAPPPASVPAPGTPEPAPASAMPHAAPPGEVPGLADGRDPKVEPRHEQVYDFGIESVFLIFHQSALIALGATHDGGPPGRVDLAEARQAITFLKILEEKTRGNLSPEEAAMLQELLSDAQMAFVQVARNMTDGGGA